MPPACPPQAKDEADKERKARLRSLADFTMAFLESKHFGVARLAVEACYNLVYTLGQHVYDADCHLFLRVFTGEVGCLPGMERPGTERGCCGCCDVPGAGAGLCWWCAQLAAWNAWAPAEPLLGASWPDKHQAPAPLLQVEEAVRRDGEQLQEDVYKMLRLLDAALNSKVSPPHGCCRPAASLWWPVLVQAPD
jgi:hypothetical protein